MKRFEIFFGLIKIPTDFLMTVVAFLIAYKLRLLTQPIEGIAKPIDYTSLPSPQEYLNFSILAAITIIIIFALGKMYTLKTTSKFTEEARKSFVLCGVWVMAIITYFFFTRTFPFSRLAIFYSFAFTLILIIFGRAIINIIQKTFLKAGIGKRKLLFLGNSKITKEISEALKKDLSYKIIGHTNNFEDIEKICKEEKIDEIIQTAPNQNEDEKILEFCKLNHINYRFIPDLLEVQKTNIGLETMYGIPIIHLKPTPLDGWGKVIKRILDLIGSTTGLVILSPIFLITGILIKIDSPGPIFFTKLENGKDVKRVGQYGKLFKFFKFRSMANNSHTLRYTELAEQNTRKDGPLVKIKNDPRITKFGRFIRKFSIDELPQLWNVLKGDMSLVGPRPHLPEEVAEYKKHHHFVFTIKPGVTGLSQISGRSDLSFEEEIKLDSFYIENWSIWLDIKIIFRTIFIVLKGHED